MEESTLKISPSGRTIRHKKGILLSEALAINGIILPSPCGGRGTCGKCLVRITGNYSPLPAADEQPGGRKQRLPEEQLACRTILTGDCEIYLPETSEQKTKQYPELRGAASLLAAVDIGTTSIHISFTETRSGRVIRLEPFLNPQRKFGDDIISRISASSKPGKLEEMTVMTRSAVFSTIALTLEANGLSADALHCIAVSGNTVMLHILAGENISSMGTHPSRPAKDAFTGLRPGDIGAEKFREAQIVFMPHLSAFIGGDIIAGLMHTLDSGFISNVFFMDLGTNGEMFLIDAEKRIFAASCAMGPALEGMNISCGITAGPGAVTAVELINERLEYKTPFGGEISGFSGTALIDLTAILLRRGIINHDGSFAPEKTGIALPRPLEFTFAGRERALILGQGLKLKQGDIRNIQLAKGASLAVSTLLLKKSGLGASEVKNVIIAGALGENLNEENFKTAFFLPNFPAAAFHVHGNTSLKGAELVLLNRGLLEEASLIKDKITEVDTASLPEFNTAFIDSLNF